MTHLLFTLPRAAVYAILGVISISTVSGCSNPAPAERNAPEFNTVTADDANEDIGTYILPQDTAILYARIQYVELKR